MNILKYIVAGILAYLALGAMAYVWSDRYAECRTHGFSTHYCISR